MISLLCHKNGCLSFPLDLRIFPQTGGVTLALLVHQVQKAVPIAKAALTVDNAHDAAVAIAVVAAHPVPATFGFAHLILGMWPPIPVYMIRPLRLNFMSEKEGMF